MANKEKELPAAMPGDEDNGAALEAKIKEAKELDDSLSVEESEDEEGAPTVTVSNAVGVNPSSTYPGRNQELAENNMQIPTSIDLAKRAAFAKTAWPAIAADAGLTAEDFDGPTETDGA